MARIAGSVPRALSTSESRLRRRKCRPMTCSAIRRAARAAIPPKTPSAIESGLIARSTLPSSSCAVASKPGGRPPGDAFVMTFVTAAVSSGFASFMAVSV